ncbi:MAG: hypothetical protein H6739_37145 [Alphaproteobacteria bacterium]|nr:hypothetical protein [Alphaproteobacteria bacterium]
MDLDAPGVRTVDLNADGVPDALRAGVGGWVMFLNLGEGAWAPGVILPSPPPVRLDDPRVFFADITGDGLADLVHVGPRRITVWPALGLGRFDAPFQLEGAPNLTDVDPRSLRWADVSGSGQADLIWHQPGQAVVFFNQAGWGLSPGEAHRLGWASGDAQLEPVDLLGSGAQGMLFTDPVHPYGHWRFLELFPEGQPELLETVDNGLGATTTIAYGSSASHWARDRAAGQPWRSAMPSAQRVVEQVTTTDVVTGNTLGVTYRYHHGVYDGVEREFRGFAQVDQLDREAEVGDPQPLSQVLVKRWYHPGVSVPLRDTYHPYPFGALGQDIPAAPGAARALRGRMLREETYSLDDTAKPYVVKESGYRVFAVGRTPGTDKLSFAPLPVTARVIHSERGTDWRRVETTTTYDLHEGRGYGLPTRVDEVGYGRKGVYTSDHEQPQTVTLSRYTTTTYHDPVDSDPGDDFGAYTPSYLIGFVYQVERYAPGSPDTLLSREKRFYDGTAYQGLGYPGSGTSAGVTQGKLSGRLVLALTDSLISATYPGGSGASAARSARGNYITDSTDHYVAAERYQYNSDGLVTGAKDPNGNTTTFTYEGTWDLFPIGVTDPAGHPTTLTRAELPFRVDHVEDANDNRTSFGYDPSGLPAWKAVQGKYVSSAWQGDPTTHPTEEYDYDFDTQPIRVLIKTRQVRQGDTFDVVRYLDGFGRVLQERHTAEPEPGSPSTPRYRVTGHQLYNHKGLVVKAWQPSFSGSSAYAEAPSDGDFVETTYDPLGRPVRVDHPDGTYETTTYHPWVREAADRNDNSGHLTGGDSRYGSTLSWFSGHEGTPTQVFMDALGREIAVEEDLGGSTTHVTRSVYNLRDEVTAVWDARGLMSATWTFGYDYAGRRIESEHGTALGARYALADAAGNPIWSRDARDIEVDRTFDALSRPLEEETDDGTDVKLRRMWTYIEYDDQHVDFATYQSKNLFGRVEEQRDADGVRFFEYDWRGLVTKTSHRFWPQEDGSAKAWDNATSDLWADGADWDPEVDDTARDSVSTWLTLNDLTDTTTIEIDASYDAAGRVTQVDYPEGMSLRTSYNAAGMPEQLELDRGTGGGWEDVVSSVEYNARGQVTRLVHGNGVETEREYDSAIERLTRIFTQLPGSPDTHLQDLEYLYDPVGNPLKITDNLSTSGYAANDIIPNTRTFRYDARYRLTRATGKKHNTITDRSTGVTVTSPDPNDYVSYDYTYAYDEVGNLTRNDEYQSTGSTTLNYKSTRIDLFNGNNTEATSTDPTMGNFIYDENGNTLSTPRITELAYTHDNQVRYVDLSGGGEVRYFRHGDQRVVRMVKKTGVMGLSIYLGPFEYHYRDATTAYTKLVLHAGMHGRHAQTEVVLDGSDPDSLDVFFHHSDHLGSGHVLTQDDGTLLSQEEYFPYGRASDRRDARNRYRFIGVERDEDTGLCMTGPRTYDPVSGRFLQGDPLISGGMSPFVYASGNPVRRSDGGGYADEEAANASGADPDSFSSSSAFDEAEEPPLVPDPPEPPDFLGTILLWQETGVLDQLRPLDVDPIPVLDGDCDDDPLFAGNKTRNRKKNGNNDPRRDSSNRKDVGHTKNPRESNRNKHEQAEKRRDKDAGTEKGDKRRKYIRRKKPPGWPGSWPPKKTIGRTIGRAGRILGRRAGPLGVLDAILESPEAGASYGYNPITGWDNLSEEEALFVRNLNPSQIEFLSDLWTIRHDIDLWIDAGYFDGGGRHGHFRQGGDE